MVSPRVEGFIGDILLWLRGREGGSPRVEGCDRRPKWRSHLPPRAIRSRQSQAMPLGESVGRAGLGQG